jgi:hypothetical protein
MLFSPDVNIATSQRQELSCGRLQGCVDMIMSRNLTFQTLSEAALEDPSRIGPPQEQAKPAAESVQFGQFRGCAIMDGLNG